MIKRSRFFNNDQQPSGPSKERYGMGMAMGADRGMRRPGMGGFGGNRRKPMGGGQTMEDMYRQGMPQPRQQQRPMMQQRPQPMQSSWFDGMLQQIPQNQRGMFQQYLQQMIGQRR